MPLENHPTSDELAKFAEQRLRDLLGQYGLKDARVLRALEEYIRLLEGAGQSEKAQALEAQARLVRQQLGSGSIGDSQTPVGVMVESESEGGEWAPDIDLYNSKGQHIAVYCQGFLYTPSGRYLAYFDPERQVFIEGKGAYFGQRFDENRLVYDLNWPLRHMNFGERTSPGNRPGWGRRKDTDRSALPSGCSEVKIEDS